MDDLEREDRIAQVVSLVQSELAEARTTSEADWFERMLKTLRAEPAPATTLVEASPGVHVGPGAHSAAVRALQDMIVARYQHRLLTRERARAWMRAHVADALACTALAEACADAHDLAEEGGPLDHSDHWIWEVALEVWETLPPARRV